MAESAVVENVENPPIPFKLSWGAIFGGAFVALGVWVLLMALGLAVGLTAMDPANPQSARGAGLTTGIWSVIVPLVALFGGGLVAARGAGLLDRTGAAIHGAVVWGLTTVGGVVLIGSVLGALVSGVAGLGGRAISAAGSAVGSAASAASSAGGPLASTLGIDLNDLMAPLNRRLAQEGKPQVTPDQIQSVVRDLASTTLRGGVPDRAQIVSIISTDTSLSQDDARDLADRLESQINNQRQQAGSTLQRTEQSLQTGALAAADKTGKAFWAVFFALLLGLASAMAGALTGMLRGTLRVSRAPVVIQREVHP
jgi:hypothetical protein